MKVPPDHTLIKDLAIGNAVPWEVEIEVWGEYLKYRPTTHTDPAEGGYFEVHDFKAIVEDIDVTPLLEVNEVQLWVNEEFY